MVPKLKCDPQNFLFFGVFQYKCLFIFLIKVDAKLTLRSLYEKFVQIEWFLWWNKDKYMSMDLFF